MSKLRANERVGATGGDSREQVRRYIRLTFLISELLENVDMQKIDLRPAVELSYLTEEEQKDLSYIIDTEEVTPSLSQAIQMKELSMLKHFSTLRKLSRWCCAMHFFAQRYGMSVLPC